jgi:hypothetical protein
MIVSYAVATPLSMFCAFRFSVLYGLVQLISRKDSSVGEAQDVTI